MTNVETVTLESLVINLNGSRTYHFTISNPGHKPDTDMGYGSAAVGEKLHKQSVPPNRF
ncbi:MAG: hypothetical protein GDA37_13300 [Ekhidna sp.]|nr:hypothetical protein [Ekhidna sp.]